MSDVGPRVGIITSRFPKVSETFILDELLALRRHGVITVPMPLRLRAGAVRHPEAAAVLLEARGTVPGGLRDVAAAQARWLRREPGAYLSAWAGAMRGTWRSPSFLLRAFAVVPLAARLAEVAQERGLDRLHAHYGTHPALAAWVIKRLTGLPYGVTLHAHDLYVDRTMLAQKLECADLVVTISEYNRRLVEREAPGVWTEVVRCGVQLGGPPTPRRAGATGPLRVLCVASLEPYKGHVHLLDAVALLRDDGVDVRLDLVGGGPLRRRLERHARRRRLSNVTFHGASARPRVQELLSRADAFALTSIVTRRGKTEGLPVAIMEAMARGLPVVASNVSGIPELVQDGRSGLLAEPGRADQVAAALHRLARDPVLRARLGDAGARAVRLAHDRESTSARLAQLMRARSLPGSDPAGRPSPSPPPSRSAAAPSR